MPTTIAIPDAFPADQGDVGLWSDLGALGTLTRHDRVDAAQIVATCAGAEAVVTNKVPFTAETFAALPDLRYLGVCATGYNIIDLEAARAHGVAVTNVPGYSTMSVAQATIALLLECTNATAAHARRVASGDWAACPDFCFLNQPITGLEGATLLLLGAGTIGSAVERIATALGMRVIAGQLPGRPAQADRVPLAEALPQADVISLHCPLTADTANLINADTLAQCREHLILLNTARGPLIDEAALADWLTAHPRARAGLDVLSAEPPAADHPLTAHPQVLVTPHNAWAGTQARARLRAEVAANLAAWQRGERRNRVD